LIIALNAFNLYPDIEKNDIVIIADVNIENAKIYCKINSYYKELCNEVFSKIHNLTQEHCPKKIIRHKLHEHNE
jgi:hypothetical protein